MTYEDAISQIEPLRYSGDLDSLERRATSLEAGTLAESPEDYLRFMLHVCDMLSSHDFRDYERQTSLMHQFALRALANAPSIPVEVELRLLAHQEEALGTSSPGQQWAAERHTRAVRWLKAMRRLDEGRKEDFDFSDLPALNVAPPAGAGLPAGVDAGEVEDPAMRTQYEEALAANHQKAEEFMRQWTLRELREHYGPLSLRAIRRAYARPPFDLAELQRILDEHVLDDETKRSLMRSVREEITAQSR